MKDFGELIGGGGGGGVDDNEFRFVDDERPSGDADADDDGGNIQAIFVRSCINLAAFKRANSATSTTILLSLTLFTVVIDSSSDFIDDF
ncbi:hypothetical protein DERP_010676 [Dermatophagoides pteronyssinus]|uniref:Uncharacterized protein n=1 Tax=Dermatophagoides pteronyssinus TaxID=6956 RepID=A0ABQ8JA71_DERPT|nr:hypothetical protein DERP_010676 [Dermatophagoides pteronyssinus]